MTDSTVPVRDSLGSTASVAVELINDEVYAKGISVDDVTGAAIAKAEDSAHASGDYGFMALTVRKDTAAATAGTDGDYQPLTTDENGNLRAGVVPGDSETKISAATMPSGGVGFVGWQSAIWYQLTQTLTATVSGAVASGATDSGNPVKVGGVYKSTVPALTDGQRGDAQVDASGSLRSLITGNLVTGADDIANTALVHAGASSASTTTARLLANASYVFDGTAWDRMRGNSSEGIIVRPYAFAASEWTYSAASGGISNTTTAVTFKAAAGASVKNYICGIDIMSEVLTNATELVIRDGAGGTVLYRTKIATSGLLAGRNITFSPPLRGTANTLLEVCTLAASGAGAVFFNAWGFTAP